MQATAPMVTSAWRGAVCPASAPESQRTARPPDATATASPCALQMKTTSKAQNLLKFIKPIGSLQISVAAQWSARRVNLLFSSAGVNVTYPSRPGVPPLSSTQILINTEMEEFQLVDLSRRFLNLDSFWSLPRQFLGNKVKREHFFNWISCKLSRKA